MCRSHPLLVEQLKYRKKKFSKKRRNRLKRHNKNIWEKLSNCNQILMHDEWPLLKLCLNYFANNFWIDNTFFQKTARTFPSTPLAVTWGLHPPLLGKLPTIFWLTTKNVSFTPGLLDTWRRKLENAGRAVTDTLPNTWETDWIMYTVENIFL